MNDLNDLLDEYIKKSPIRFHMPGHKGRNEEKKYYDKDISDLNFSDNLFSSCTVLLKLKENLKDTFNALYSYPLVNGSTAGVVAAILGSVKKKEKILLSRNSHISEYYGISIAKADPIFLYPKSQVEDIDINEYIEVIKNDDIKAVLITYPNYFGYCTKLEVLIKEIKRINEDIIVIVDEAHGTHMFFSEEYPKSAAKSGADIVINSVHKTLTGLTQTSLLNIYSKKVNINNIELALKFMQSTSPSYLFLSSIEDAIDYANKNAKRDLKRIKEDYLYVKNKLKDTSFYIDDFDDEKHHDYLKLCINTSKSSLSSYELLDILEKRYNIYLEFAIEDIAVCYLGLNTKKEDMIALLNALYDIDKKYNDKIINKMDTKGNVNKQILIPKRKKEMDECMFCDKKEVNFIKSEGEICADFIISYPPGYPILIPGEKIERNMIEYLLTLKKNNHKIVGIKDDNILTYIGE